MKIDVHGFLDSQPSAARQFHMAGLAAVLLLCVACEIVAMALTPHTDAGSAR